MSATGDVPVSGGCPGPLLRPWVASEPPPPPASAQRGDSLRSASHISSQVCNLADLLLKTSCMLLRSRCMLLRSPPPLSRLTPTLLRQLAPTPLVRQLAPTPLLSAVKRRCLSTAPPASARAHERVDRWLSEFSAGLASGRAHESFAPERSFWRDMVAFTWSIRTFEGAAQIGQALAATSPAAQPHEWCTYGTPTEDTTEGSLECWLRFKTAAGGGKALLKLDKEGKASSLFTLLSDLDTRPFATGSRRALGHPCASIDDIATPRPGRPRRTHTTRHTPGPGLLHHDLLLRHPAASDNDLRLHLRPRPHVDREAEHPRVTADNGRARSAGVRSIALVQNGGVRAHKRRQQMMVLMPM